MRGPDVAWATYAEKPDPAPDDRLCIERLAEAGLVIEAAPWTARPGPWRKARMVLLRSTWDYYRDRPAFLRWLRSVARSTPVWNPPEVVRWNTDKSYLAALARAGVPVVPTREVRPGESRGWSEQVRGLGDDRVVVKPLVSADGYRTRIFRVDDARRGRAHLRAVLSGGPALVQRYLPASERREERSLVYLDGSYSHAVRRTPILLPGGRGGPEPAAPPPPAARRLADLALDRAGARGLLYARVDVLPDPEGVWRLLELELTEPTLYLDRDPRAPGRLARGVLRRLGARATRPTARRGVGGTARPGSGSARRS